MAAVGPGQHCGARYKGEKREPISLTSGPTLRSALLLRSSRLLARVNIWLSYSYFRACDPGSGTLAQSGSPNTVSPRMWHPGLWTAEELIDVG